MHFKKFILLTCLVPVCWMGGCGQKQGRFTEEQMQAFPLAERQNLPGASGGMAISLHSETITVDEVLQAVEEPLRPAAGQMERQTFVRQSLPLIRQAIRSKTSDILLYAQARKHAPDNVDDALDRAVQQEINRFIASYNNNYALAEARIRQMGMDWRSFREYQRKLMLTQSYLSSKLNADVRFTHSQMREHYEAVKAEQFCRSGTLEFHAIDLVPAQLDSEHIAEGQTADEAAMELAKKLVAQARAGGDFAELAREHSHGPLARNGGRWRPVTIGAEALAEPYDVLEDVALTLEEGEISDPVVHEDHIFIVWLNRKELGGCKPFSEVQAQIEQQLEFEYRQKQYENYISELMRQVDQVELEQFAEFCANAAYDHWNRAG